MIKIPYFTNSLPNGSFALRRCPVGQVHRHFRWFWTGEGSTTSRKKLQPVFLPDFLRAKLRKGLPPVQGRDACTNNFFPVPSVFKIAWRVPEHSMFAWTPIYMMPIFCIHIDRLLRWDVFRLGSKTHYALVYREVQIQNPKKSHKMISWKNETLRKQKYRSPLTQTMKKSKLQNGGLLKLILQSRTLLSGKDSYKLGWKYDIGNSWDKWGQIIYKEDCFFRKSTSVALQIWFSLLGAIHLHTPAASKSKCVTSNALWDYLKSSFLHLSEDFRCSGIDLALVRALWTSRSSQVCTSPKIRKIHRSSKMFEELQQQSKDGTIVLL